MINVPSRPSPLEIDLERTAVLVIDMQNDFGAPGGMFDHAGIDISAIRAAAVTSVRMIAAARGMGLPIVFVAMGHPADLSNIGPLDGPHWLSHMRLRVGEESVAPDGTTGRILVNDTWNTEIIDELKPEPGDVVATKHRCSTSRCSLVGCRALKR